MDGEKEKRGEINGMSYGKIMTSMLIPKDSRTNPRRIISGLAFVAFIAFFVFSAMGRGCQNNTVAPTDQATPPAVSTDTGS